MTIDSILELAKSGRVLEAQEAALDAVEAASGPMDCFRLALVLLSSQTEAHIQAGLALLKPHIAHPALTPDILSLYAQQAWLHGGGPATTAEAARMALKRNPKLVQLYRTLGMALICLHDYEQAHYVCGAGMALTGNPQQFHAWHQLSHLLWSGATETKFERNGKTYRFGLNIFNSMAMEAAAHHMLGVLTEQAELDILAQQVGSGRRIVELGTLVGNHTLFFLNEMAPASMFLIDGSTASLAETRRNIERNFGSAWPCPIQFVHRFVGLESKLCTFLGEQVQQDPLDVILDGHDFDFIKIDADGAELELLDGAMDVLSARKPDIMLEVTTENRAPALARLSPLGYRCVASVNHHSYENLLLRL